jgi:RecJ-like exonuclease
VSKLKLYTFSDRAKKNLKALPEYKMSDVVKLIKNNPIVDDDTGHSTVVADGLIITLLENKIVAIRVQRSFGCVVCQDTLKVQVGDPCDFCDGVGCKECKEGLVFKTIACPNCKGKQKIGDTDEWSIRNRLQREQSHGNRRPIPGKTSVRKRRKAGPRD